MTTEEKMQMEVTPPVALGIARRRRRIAGGALLALVAMVVFGCLEEIEPDFESSFNKVYGLDGRSWGIDMIESEDGGFVIVGHFRKTPDIQIEEPIEGPFILKTDANGNELGFRNFNITRANVTNLSELFGLPESDTILYTDWVFGRPFFNTVTELQNGNYLVSGQIIGDFGDAFGNVGSTSGGPWFIVIMDPEFKPLSVKYLNNSDIELVDGKLRFYFWRVPKPLLLENGDVLMISGSVFQQNAGRFSGFSIIRITENGEVSNVWDYPINPETYSEPDSWVLDGFGNAIVCTSAYDPLPLSQEDSLRDNSIQLYKINISSGAITDSTVIGRTHYNNTWKGGILATANGFVLGDYHIDTVGEKNSQLAGDGTRNWIGGLWFINNDLDSLGKVHLTGPEVDQQTARIVQTADGGYAAAYWRPTAFGKDVLVVKSDSNGNPLWSRVLSTGFDEGQGSIINSNPIAKMIGAQDGSVAILGNLDFNSTGARINLIKLDANGGL